MSKPASRSWSHKETNPERIALLAAADRLLAGEPTRSTGNLSIVQLAKEAGLKYWVVVQKHTDLRDHFQQLALLARNVKPDSRATTDLKCENTDLRARCASLERLVQKCATVINEQALEIETLRAQTATMHPTVRSISTREAHRSGPQS
ncbi:Uncharacterised protein [Mycobacteroides abscessus subsp. massiliense]|nr:Uncharacterised protein [Mycobacteroides abscessus subsp. massiliense]SKH81559.1 Uncharacterised protein [Mycobacteroides abscessus subsp. massiliense]SKI09032.1 Uncharacterised protein [Mycobacteroides abscessus subsp. massiliense]SKK13702.1 Uncharacterised protein [Mycobacteroides abscessus subsp. massiliense]